MGVPYFKSIVRYRTGDITMLHEAPCSCSRTSARIDPILRRTDHRLSIRGILLSGLRK